MEYCGQRRQTLAYQRTLLSDNDRKERLSFAYLSALSAFAGYTCQSGAEPDRYSVDATVRSGETMRPQIDVQLKATSVPNLHGDGLHFQLGSKNYNDLCEFPRGCPLILVVLELPEDPDEWINWDDEGLTMHRRAWWLSISRLPEIDEGSSKTVVIPQSQFLSPDSLTKLMYWARTSFSTGGEAP